MSTEGFNTTSRGPLSLNVARVLLAVAVAGSGYLAVVSLTDGQVAGCGALSDCHSVLQSRWAYWLNLPVSVPAFLVYATTLACTFLQGRKLTADSERGTWAAIIVLCTLIVGGALWFIGLQLLVIKAVCILCMATHLSAAAAAVLCLFKVPLASDPATPMWTSAQDKRGVPGHAVLSLILIGIIGLGVLPGIQLAAPTNRNLVRVIPPNQSEQSQAKQGHSPTRTNSVPSGSPNLQRVSPEWISMYGGQFTVLLNEVPMMGSPASSNVIVYLFDYTCSHCRDLHHILANAQKQLSNSLGVVTIPMPMSSNCNLLIPPDFTSSADACDYARYGLAMWRISSEQYHAYDEWFFSQEPIPSLESARTKADALVGKERFAAALRDPWITQQIEFSCRLHFANWQASGRPAMPQIVMGTAISVGPLSSVRHLYALLNRYVGIEPPARVRSERTKPASAK